MKNQFTYLHLQTPYLIGTGSTIQLMLSFEEELLEGRAYSIIVTGIAKKCRWHRKIKILIKNLDVG